MKKINSVKSSKGAVKKTALQNSFGEILKTKYPACMTFNRFFNDKFYLSNKDRTKSDYINYVTSIYSNKAALFFLNKMVASEKTSSRPIFDNKFGRTLFDFLSANCTLFVDKSQVLYLKNNIKTLMQNDYFEEICEMKLSKPNEKVIKDFLIAERVKGHDHKINKENDENALLCEFNGEQFFLWRFFKKLTLADIEKIILSSNKILEDWLNQGLFDLNKSHFYKNMVYLNSFFKMSDEELNGIVNMLRCFHIFKNNKALSGLSLNVCALYSKEMFFSFVSSIIGEKQTSIAEWCSLGSFLDKMGVIEIDKNNTPLIFRKGTSHERTMDGYYPFPDEMHCKYDNPKDVLKIFFTLAQSKGLIPKDYYAFIGKDYNSIRNLLSSSPPSKILIWGEPGNGKTELVHSIAHDLKKDVIVPSLLEDPEKPKDDKNFLNPIRKAKTFSEILENPILLVDECDYVLKNEKLKASINELLEETIIPEVWIINDLRGVEPAYLRRFDRIIKIEEPAVNYRVEMAKRLFDDKNLANRVAQGARNFAEIDKIYQWCRKNNNYTWDYVSDYLSSYNKALQECKPDKNKMEMDIHYPSNQPMVFAGYEHAKKEAKMIVKYFSQPEKMMSLNIKPPKGVLLSGPSGTGKTLFARYIANQANVPVLIAKSSFMSQSPQNIAKVFAEARATAPCLLFIDEMDVLGADPGGLMGPNTQKQQILNEFLVEMDGFSQTDGVFVIGATYKLGLLDKALLRSGRFGQVINFHEPVAKDRKEIITAYMEDKKIKENFLDTEIETLVNLTSGLNCADLHEMINQAGICAFMEDADKIEFRHMTEACDAIYWGNPQDYMILNQESRYHTAIHEAGHALLAHRHGLNIQRISVRPRNQFLGVVQWIESEDNSSFFKEDIKKRIDVSLGGMIAEEVMLKKTSTGVSQDLVSVKSWLMRMLTRYGMGDSFGKMVSLPMEQVSESLTIKLEAEIQGMINDSYQSSRKWINANKSQLESFAKIILDKREMHGNEIQMCFSGMCFSSS